VREIMHQQQACSPISISNPLLTSDLFRE